MSIPGSTGNDKDRCCAKGKEQFPALGKPEADTTSGWHDFLLVETPLPGIRRGLFPETHIECVHVDYCSCDRIRVAGAQPRDRDPPAPTRALSYVWFSVVLRLASKTVTGVPCGRRLMQPPGGHSCPTN